MYGQCVCARAGLCVCALCKSLSPASTDSTCTIENTPGYIMLLQAGGGEYLLAKIPQ